MLKASDILASAVGSSLVGNVGFLDFTVVEFTGAGVHTWTPPAGVTEVFMAVGGAGGSGGQSRNNTGGKANTGGGGGGCAGGLMAVTPGNDLTITLGAGGVTSGSETTDGIAGGASSITGFDGALTLSATGGLGGLGGATVSTTNYAAGGTGSGGDFQFTGGRSGYANNTFTATGGGAAATIFGDGGNGGDADLQYHGTGGGAPKLGHAAADGELGAGFANIGGSRYPGILVPSVASIDPYTLEVTHFSTGIFAVEPVANIGSDVGLTVGVGGSHDLGGGTGKVSDTGTADDGGNGGAFGGGGGGVSYSTASSKTNGGLGGHGAGGAAAHNWSGGGQASAGDGGDGWAMIAYRTTDGSAALKGTTLTLPAA